LLGAFTYSEYEVLAQGEFDHPGGFHSQAQISKTKEMIQQNVQPWEDASNDLIAEANGYLAHSPQAVEDFYAPGYYDDPDGSMAAKHLIHGDGFAAYTCALAYQLDESSQRIQYASKAVEILNSWATINETVSGVDGNEYMCCGGIGLILAADLLWDYDGWNLTDRNSFEDWVSSVFQNSANTLKTISANRGCWGIWASISAAYLLDDEQTINADIDRIKDRVSWYIAEDGHIPLETNSGSSGMWYTYYALAPLTAACQVAFNATGTNLFNYMSTNSRSIRLALNFFIYYLEHPDEWPFYGGEDLMTLGPHSSAGQLYMAMASIYEDDGYENWVTSLGPVSDSTWWDNVHIAWKFPVLMQPSPTMTWESYSDLGHTTLENSFSGATNHVYMRGEGFDTTGTYKVAYYDGGTNHDGADGAQIQVDVYTNDADGVLESECLFTSHGSSSYGTWHAVVYKTAGIIPYSYDLVSNSDPDYVVEDSFYVEQSAIPEFPTALGAIAALVLSASFYIWFRRKFAPVPS
jgi:hypothetical protein